MKQRKLFKEKKEEIYSYLQAHKETTIIVMFAILCIGFFINIYYSYFDKDEKPDRTRIEDFNTDAIFSKPPNIDINSNEAFELMMLHEELKNPNITEEKLSEINKRIDEIMKKEIDTTDVLIK